MEFKNLNELKERLKPALTTRKNELLQMEIIVSEEEIWDYLMTFKWKNAHGLTLDEMVNDILKYNKNW